MTTNFVCGIRSGFSKAQKDRIRTTSEANKRILDARENAYEDEF
jgi:hypothetical protein